MHLPRLRPVLALTGLLVLSACLFPEKFSSQITFASNGNYHLSFDGTMVMVEAAATLQQGGQLSPQDEVQLKKGVADIKKERCVKEASYEGRGRYKVSMDCDYARGEPLTLFDNIITVTWGKDGVVTIASAKVTEKDKQGLKELGLKLDGKFDVKLPSGTIMIEQNADSTPTFGLGTYSWKIGNIDKTPLMRFKLG